MKNRHDSAAASRHRLNIETQLRTETLALVMQALDGQFEGGECVDLSRIPRAERLTGTFLDAALRHAEHLRKEQARRDGRPIVD